MHRILLSLIVLSFAVAGCVAVKPYQRETLAHPCMADAPWPLVERAEQHVFEVREGTAGATGTAGGGCGCN